MFFTNISFTKRSPNINANAMSGLFRTSCYFAFLIESGRILNCRPPATRFRVIATATGFFPRYIRKELSYQSLMRRFYLSFCSIHNGEDGNRTHHTDLAKVSRPLGTCLPGFLCKITFIEFFLGYLFCTFGLLFKVYPPLPPAVDFLYIVPAVHGHVIPRHALRHRVSFLAIRVHCHPVSIIASEQHSCAPNCATAPTISEWPDNSSQASQLRFQYLFLW